MDKFPLGPILPPLLAVGFAAVTALPHTAHADWKLVDDFQSYGLGTVLEINSPWTGHRASGTASVFEEGKNRYFGFGWNGTSDYRSVSRPLPDHLALRAGESATFFLRFRANAPLLNDSNFGLAFDPAIDLHDSTVSYRVQTGLRPHGTAGMHNLVVWDGEGPRVLTPIESGVWYNLWYVIDRESDTFKLYLTTGVDAATEADRLSDGGTNTFFFRSGGSAGDVLNYIMGAGNLTSGTAALRAMHLDNIWMDKTGENLSYVSMDTLADAIQWPFLTEFGSNEGLDDGNRLARGFPAEWSLEPEAFRLAGLDPANYDSIATLNVVNFIPESAFAARARMTLHSLGSGVAENKVLSGIFMNSRSSIRGSWVSRSSRLRFHSISASCRAMMMATVCCGTSPRVFFSNSKVCVSHRPEVLFPTPRWLR